MARRRVHRHAERRQPEAPARAGARTAAASAFLHRLQHPAGNRAARAALRAGMPSIATLAPAQRMRVLRAWVASASPKEEVWDQPDSKHWKRRQGSGGYEYFFTLDSSSTMDAEYEAEWKSRSAWEALSIHPPTDAAAPVTAAEPQAETDDDDEYEEEWDVDRLIEAVNDEGIEGVCNALTTSYLLDFLDPSEDKVGLSTVAFEKTVLLKALLDSIVKAYSTVESADVTFAFVRWARAGGMTAEWLETLSRGNVDARLASFKSYFHTARRALPVRGGTTIEGTFEALSGGAFYTKIDAMLEPTFDMRSPFQGVVVIKATVLSTRAVAAHQFAIRYAASGTFEIFDQNTGLEIETVDEQEDIAEALSRHLELYVKNPMRAGGRPTNHGVFQIQIHP